MSDRCNWVLDNPDIVVTLHAIRVELLVRCVMSHVVPEDELEPFLYWLRFEFGQNGNPHAHGVAYVAGNPEFDLIVKDAATRDALAAKYIQEAADLRTWDEAPAEVADFYNPYVRETHPCKDLNGEPRWPYRTALYELEVDNKSLQAAHDH